MNLVIDGRTVPARPRGTILEASLEAGIYIPALCRHPELPSASKCKPCAEVFRGRERIVAEGDAVYRGCGLCVVRVEGAAEPVLSCETEAREGMAVETGSPELKSLRRQALAAILKDHPRACLSCAQKEGCSREPCSANVPVAQRCCSLLGRCELEKLAGFLGVPQDLGSYAPRGIPVDEDEPLFRRDYNLCVGCLRCVRACQDLSGAEALGYVMRDGVARVGAVRGPAMLRAGCRFCGACVEVCPTGALADRKPFAASEKEKALVPCRAACPAGMDIPAYVRAIADGDPDRAVGIVLETLPFPGILGMACDHPCEEVCRRGELDQAVAICAVKRFAAEKGARPKAGAPAAPTGKRVAVIGSGPAGVAAAHSLKGRGHQVAVFEAEEKAGGMLRYGIPPYRLSGDVLDRELSAALEGIELRTRTALGRDFQLGDLLKDGFHAVFLATGATLSKRIELPGAGSEGVYWGVDLLKDAAKGKPFPPWEKVAVIGGGNVAVDVALMCFRLGAREVSLACLESEREMPAFSREIVQAREEGVRIMNGWGPKAIECEGGRARGVTLRRCIRVFDEGGRFSPQYDESVRNRLAADSVVLAVGQRPDAGMAFGPGMPEADGAGFFKAEDTRTTAKAVFAGGDGVRGPSSVVEAMADGRRAAERIHRFLGGTAADGPPRRGADPGMRPGEKFSDRPRAAPPRLDPQRRKRSLSPIESGYGEDEAVGEARRCLQCQRRLGIRGGALPPEKWLPLTREALACVREKEGVYQLADAEKTVTCIAGTQNLLKDLAARLEKNGTGYFRFEEHPMYSKRESELLQQHLLRHGKMPGSGAGDLDDLF